MIELCAVALGAREAEVEQIARLHLCGCGGCGALPSGSLRGSVKVLEQATKPLAALDGSVFGGRRRPRPDELAPCNWAASSATEEVIAKLAADLFRAVTLDRG